MRKRPTTILLILALCAGMLVPGPAGAQDKTLLEVCLDHDQAWMARAEACRTAAEQGHVKAQVEIGYMYYTGKELPHKPAKAAEWFRRAAEQGHTTAQHNLGLMYDNGEGVPQDRAKAVEWYRRAVKQGHAGAQNSLGYMYDKGRGVRQDYTKALEWYHRAAEQGHAGAQFNLGLMYDNGEGVPQDSAKAVEWYARAAEQGDAAALHNLAAMYDHGHDMDSLWLARLYQKAAKQGSEKARFMLGVLAPYENGVWYYRRGDYKKSAQWYRIAAEGGHPKAQYSLGYMYSEGEGVPQDHREAIRWYRRAAKNGLGKAQDVLSAIHEKIEPVFRAAEEGDAHSQYRMGVAYHRGIWIPKDDVHSYMWLSLAASGGSERAGKLRDQLKAGLTPEEVAEAEAEVRRRVEKGK